MTQFDNLLKEIQEFNCIHKVLAKFSPILHLSLLKIKDSFDIFLILFKKSIYTQCVQPLLSKYVVCNVCFKIFISTVFTPQGIVLTHGVRRAGRRPGGGKKFVRAVSQKLYGVES